MHDTVGTILVVVWAGSLTHDKSALQADINRGDCAGRARLGREFGLTPMVKGADALLSAVAKMNVQEAYPSDARSRLWPRPAEPSWFAEMRTQHAEKVKAA